MNQSHDNRIDLVRPDAPELAAHGPHTIGVRTIEIVNPNQLDIASMEAGQPPARYNRPLTLEVWYPANVPAQGVATSPYDAFLRDGRTRIRLHGRAIRDAAPTNEVVPQPLVIISHGFLGNRFLLSHFGENLASKGYVVASIDHTDSTYDAQGPFGSTLVNRRLDQLFVLSEMDRLSQRRGHFLHGLVDASRTAVIGYSMGGYGAVITAGGGVSAAIVNADMAPREKAMAVHLAGSDSHASLIDARIKAVVPIAPWGRNHGVWDADGLAGIRIPALFMAGSDDDVSGYADGVRKIFEESVHSDRYLLTFHHANHNAAAPIPAPLESWTRVDHLDFVPFEHYADPVWDSVRMNNIAQHFATAFLGRHLRGESTMDAYLTLTENAGDGVHTVDESGTQLPEHTYWKGFQNRTALGLSLKHALPA